jgi:hypothetical protein
VAPVNAQPVARALAAGRVAIGAALCAAPQLAAQWVGADGRRPGARTLTRALGARDAALGLGTLAAADTAELRHWLLASSLSDAVDLAATFGRPPSGRRSAVMAMAAGATATSLLLFAAATEEVDG